MKSKRRFVASITATAKSDMPSLPFQRGAPRAAMIARREALKTAAPQARRA